MADFVVVRVRSYTVFLPKSDVGRVWLRKNIGINAERRGHIIKREFEEEFISVLKEAGLEIED